MGPSLIQRSPTECDGSECDREASIMRRHWPTRGCGAMEKYIKGEIMCLYQSSNWSCFW
jgi:hypothetical protein